jgi:hypothetical protein
MSRESALRTKGQAFRWALWFIAGCFVSVGLTFARTVPVEVAYWVGIALALAAVGAMAVYFVAHMESRS